MNIKIKVYYGENLEYEDSRACHDKEEYNYFCDYVLGCVKDILKDMKAPNYKYFVYIYDNEKLIKCLNIRKEIKAYDIKRKISSI